MNLSHPIPLLLITCGVIFLVRQVSSFFRFRFVRLISTPLVTWCICGIAVVGLVRSGGAEWAILAGLGLSVIADSVLMIQGVDLFTHGLLFFLLTHIFYNIVFAAGYTFLWWDLLTAGILIGLMVFLVIMFHRGGNLGKMVIPVIVYIVALSLIVYFTVNSTIRETTTVNILRMTGAILFYVSDAILGWAQFVKYFRLSNFFVWTFYAPGQLLIGLSLVG